MRSLATAIIVIAVLSSAALARADGRDPAGAEALFREGRRLVEAGDYARACAKFEESERLDPAPGTVLNLADCMERRGKLASAWQRYEQLLHELPHNDDRYAFASEHMVTLARRVPRLTVVIAQGAPDGTTVQRDGVELGEASLGVALPVDPGKHRVVARAPGRADRAVEVALAAGESRTVAASPGDAATPTSLADSTSSRKVGGWVLAGAGVASLGLGTYFGLHALSLRSESDAGCTNGVCRTTAAASAYDDAKSYARVSDVMLGVGIVAVVAGAWIVLSAKDASGEEPPAGAAAGATTKRGKHGGVSIIVTPVGIGGSF